MNTLRWLADNFWHGVDHALNGWGARIPTGRCAACNEPGGEGFRSLTVTVDPHLPNCVLGHRVHISCELDLVLLAIYFEHLEEARG